MELAKGTVRVPVPLQGTIQGSMLVPASDLDALELQKNWPERLQSLVLPEP